MFDADAITCETTGRASIGGCLKSSGKYSMQTNSKIYKWIYKNKGVMGERVLTGTENGWRVMIGRQIALLAAMHFCNAPTLSPNIQYIGFFRHPPMFVMVTWKPVEHPCGLNRANCHKYLGVRLCCVILLCHIFDYYSILK